MPGRTLFASVLSVKAAVSGSSTIGKQEEPFELKPTGAKAMVYQSGVKCTSGGTARLPVASGRVAYLGHSLITAHKTLVICATKDMRQAIRRFHVIRHGIVSI